MKKTLADLLSPRWRSYLAVGELAKTLQFLMHRSDEFRDQSRWGTSGPREILVNYAGCVNSSDQVWHSHRIITHITGKGNVTSWEQNRNALHDCIFASLCDDSPASIKWRNAMRISLETVLRFPIAYQHADREREAWKEFESLHRFRRSDVATFNDCHRRVNVLAAPELVITPKRIFIECYVTQLQELRLSPLCFSRWPVCFLLRDAKKNNDALTTSQHGGATVKPLRNS